MTSDFAEIHDELRAVARKILGSAGAAADWTRFADAGWLGMEVDDALGGAGATFVETAVVLEEVGRAAAPSRYLGTVLAVGALIELAPNASRDELLSAVGAGTTTAALVTSPFRLRRNGSDGRLSGRAEFVPDAVGADRVLVLADDDGTSVLVDATGLTVTAHPLLDETRSLGVVSADDLAVDAASVWRLDADAVTRLRDRAAVAVACDSLGIGEAMLAATVEYAAVRQQFGRPIGSFQAVKHSCADMLVRLSVARVLVDAAVARVADGVDASVAASMAKSYACEAAVDVAGKAMQLHGGIGYTWESGLHVYLKRAALNRAQFGAPGEHRQRLARRYG
ncbi:acyl-CoA/acyl-ACP dehydrogenase [Mycobacterium yunnanensis]|uniref:Acyl-CoA/acyl-ACP dehydrogenase n=1 Tax=Mycobacterium yunnanensis TaxID=368477 RepID=A0A9X2Z6Y6_9MYCO|nr:acyl-CoA dehydrogenase family protein [Mycobacterium yunnanensis]MCV7423206.1 acyl-CoA/acyl-ACP dehydrogenase [Mycobacterium yunnanensis]